MKSRCEGLLENDGDTVSAKHSAFTAITELYNLPRKFISVITIARVV